MCDAHFITSFVFPFFILVTVSCLFCSFFTSCFPPVWLSCPYLFHLCWLLHLCLVTLFVYSLCFFCSLGQYVFQFPDPSCPSVDDLLLLLDLLFLAVLFIICLVFWWQFLIFLKLCFLCYFYFLLHVFLALLLKLTFCFCFLQGSLLWVLFKISIPDSTNWAVWTQQSWTCSYRWTQRGGRGERPPPGALMLGENTTIVPSW